MRINEVITESVPQPGPSSGAPKQFGPDAKIQTRQMTVKDIISSIPGVPYYNNVVDDWDAKDYNSWNVTEKAIEYATYLKDHPETLADLDPIIVLNGKFEDGAHRVSAIWLLQQRLDPTNPLWKNAKLNVQFVESGVSNESLEEGWKDWVAGGAMALGALGASGDAQAAKHPSVNTPQAKQQAVAQPRKITPEESRGGQTPEQLKEYILACAQRYLPKNEIARFMGEVAHETANFTSMIEKNPEKNIRHYGKKGNPLGNKDMNDAWRYIGRGFLQITGKYNYKYFGDKIRPGLGDELLANPNLALRKDVAAALAVVYWRERVAPKIQSGANSKEIAMSINGRKPKGLKSREAKTRQAAAALSTNKG